MGVTRTPADGWVAQQVREATPFGEAPRFLIAITMTSMACVLNMP
jgi:hypothetical protein